MEPEAESESESESGSGLEFEPEPKPALPQKYGRIPKLEPEKEHDPAYRYKYLHKYESGFEPVHQPTLCRRYELGTVPESETMGSMTKIGQLNIHRYRLDFFVNLRTH